MAPGTFYYKDIFPQNNRTYPINLNQNISTMNTEDQVLEALKGTIKPLSAGQVAEQTGLDRKVVDKAMAKLKAEEKIVSPQRCYWIAK